MPLLDDDEHAQQGLPGVRGELVGVPAQVRLPRVAVDGAQHARGRRHAQIVLVVVAGQGGVVGLDVQLEVLVQPVRLQEAYDGLSVVVVLVRRGLPRLGLDAELRVHANLLLVLHGHLQEGREVVQLVLDLGVQRCDEALATAPEDVVGRSQLLANVQHLLRLGTAVRERVEIRRRACAVFVPGV